jgi:hypothetical protein
LTSRRLIAILGLFTIVGVLVGAAAALWRPFGVPSLDDSMLTCGVSSSGFLPGATFGDFRPLTDGRFSEPPIAIARNGSLASAWLGGRLIGRINAIALTGKYKAENDALARSLGYRPTSTPLVPLIGTVVQDNPGPLESYESHFVFSTQSAASGWLDQTRKSSFATGAVNADIGDASIAVSGVMPPNDGQHETFAAVYAVVGDVAYVLNVLGGRDVTRESVVTDAALGVSILRQTCGAEKN